MNKKCWIIVAISCLITLISVSKTIKLSHEVDQLQNQETYIFTEARRMLDAGNFTGALTSYKSFVADFPDSNRINTAKEIIEEIEQKVAHEQHKRQLQELSAKLQKGMLTVPELIPFISGKSKNQVIDILGPPDQVFQNGNQLQYYHKAFSELKRSNDTILKINFSYGVVYSIGLNGEQQYLAR